MRRSRYRHAERSRPKSFNSLLHMCAITAFIILLVICWIPNELFYVLSKFSITQFDTPLHRATVVLAILNSCVNPWINGATNRNYSKRFTRILCFRKNAEVAPEQTNITPKEGAIRRRNDKKFSNLEPLQKHQEGSKEKPKVPSEEDNIKITMTGIPCDAEDNHIRDINGQSKL